jgi:hypothetical protein
MRTKTLTIRLALPLFEDISKRAEIERTTVADFLRAAAAAALEDISNKTIIEKLDAMNAKLDALEAA